MRSALEFNHSVTIVNDDNKGYAWLFSHWLQLPVWCRFVYGNKTWQTIYSNMQTKKFRWFIYLHQKKWRTNWCSSRPRYPVPSKQWKKMFIQLLKYDYELCFYLNLYTFSPFALSSSFLASELLFLQPKEQKLLQCILLAGALFRWTENKIRMDSDEGSNRYEMGILELLIALDEYRIFDNAITIGLVIIHIFTIH